MKVDINLIVLLYLTCRCVVVKALMCLDWDFSAKYNCYEILRRGHNRTESVAVVSLYILAQCFGLHSTSIKPRLLGVTVCLYTHTQTERERRTTARHRYTHRHGDTSTHTHKKSDTHRERKRERLRHKHRLTKTHKQTQRNTSSDTHKLRHIFITSHIWDRLTVRVCLCKKPSEC